MLNYFDVIKAQSGVPVKDIWAQLWGNTMSTEYVITTYEGTLPATLTGTKAGYLHRYKVYGNLSQNGTPAPSDPIYPSECGERTGNLFDKNNTEGIEDNYYINKITGNKVSNSQYYISAPIAVTSGETYYWVFRLTSGGSTHSSPTVGFYDVNDNQIGVASHNNLVLYFSFTTPADCAYIRASVYKIDINEAMLVKSSTVPTSYIPYGYKLPLLSGSTLVDIYLGESQTTRRIKKVVLTGTENWGYNDSNHTAYLTTPDSFLGEGVSVISTHYTAVSNKTAYSQLSDKQCCLRKNGNYVWVRDNDYSTVEDFKTYLAQQYANGTPVTVWYILATEETGTLNEPLRKIGDYADTLDSTQTTAQIPTTANSTTISWGGQGLAPSKVELEYEKRR